MPTLPSRPLRHHQPALSPDDFDIREHVGEQYRRSFDEPSIGSSQRTTYSNLPMLLQEPARPPQPSARNSKSHIRSRSHPFPSLFGTGRKRSESLNFRARAAQDFVDDDDDDDDDYAPQLDGPSSPSRRKAYLASDHRRLEDRDTESGRCMTCNSQVIWPKGLRTFRCATCSMVNDLERWNRHASNNGQQDEAAGKQSVARSTATRRRK